MLKNIVRLSALGFIWARYKTVIISTCALFGYFWLVASLHRDYLEFAHLNDDISNIGLSFILKWLAFIVGVIIYLMFNGRNRQPKPVAIDPTPTPAEQENKDPFDNIRHKDKLRSAADLVIDKGSNPQAPTSK